MNVTILSPTFDASGYAEAARSIIFGLSQEGYSVRVIAKDWSQLNAGLSLSKKQGLLELCGTKIWPKGPILHIREAQDFQPIPGRTNIGFTMLECDRLPQHWVDKCNKMDQIWTPSTFNEQTFRSSGVNPQKLKVMPLSVDANRFRPDVPPVKIERDAEQFVFLSNFEWVPRKGYDILLRAYVEEFSGQDSVLLLIKTYDGNRFDPSGRVMRRTWDSMVESMNIQDPPALQFITTGFSDHEIPSFYTAGNCYVIPTRGEGWNLPALEAMASGIPVIATNWSAHLDFLNAENSYLIKVDRLEPIPKYGIPNDEIYDGAKWAVPSLTDLRKLMRYAVIHRQEVKAKGQLARDQVVRDWNSTNMIERIKVLLADAEEST